MNWHRKLKLNTLLVILCALGLTPFAQTVHADSTYTPLENSNAASTDTSGTSEAQFQLDAGHLWLRHVPDYDFGKYNVHAASTFVLAKSDVGVSPSRLLTVEDTRGTHEGWTVNMQLSKFKDTTDGHELNVSSMDFDNPDETDIFTEQDARGNYVGATGTTGNFLLKPTDVNATGAMPDTLTAAHIVPGDPASHIIWTANTNRGYGIWALDFTGRKSVTMQSDKAGQTPGAYEATMNWTLTSGYKTSPSETTL